MLNPISGIEECENCGTFIEEKIDNMLLCEDCYEINQEERELTPPNTI